MANIIVTGHGHFATGIASTIELLAGPQPHLQFVDFTSNMDETQLHDALQAKLVPDTPTIFFCDLLGGTPFKQAVTLSTEVTQAIAVVCGANVASLLEVAISLDDVTDVDALADKIVSLSQASTVHFKRHAPAAEPEDDEEGI